MFLNSKQQIRDIPWGENHLWDVKLFDAPAPFDEWFPAISISENVYTMENHQFQFYTSTYSVSKSTAEFTLSVTYQDDENLTLLTWFSDWVNNTILGDETGLIATLEEAAKRIQVVKLRHSNGAKVPAGPIVSYLVIPDGSGNYEGESSTGPLQYTMDLIIVGKAAA